MTWDQLKEVLSDPKLAPYAKRELAAHSATPQGHMVAAHTAHEVRAQQAQAQQAARMAAMAQACAQSAAGRLASGGKLDYDAVKDTYYVDMPDGSRHEVDRAFVAQNYASITGNLGGANIKYTPKQDKDSTPVVSTRTLHSVDVRKRKMEMAVDKLVAQIPMAMVPKIESIDVRQSSDPAKRGEVIDTWIEMKFAGGKSLRFDNIDTFPTDADVSRVMIVCP